VIGWPIYGLRRAARLLARLQGRVRRVVAVSQAEQHGWMLGGTRLCTARVIGPVRPGRQLGAERGPWCSREGGGPGPATRWRALSARCRTLAVVRAGCKHRASSERSPVLPEHRAL